jgi:hypothetical protein
MRPKVNTFWDSVPHSSSDVVTLKQSTPAGCVSIVPPNGQTTYTLTWIIVAAFLGFALLAFLLLYPIYRFLKKEAARNNDE